MAREIFEVKKFVIFFALVAAPLFFSHEVSGENSRDYLRNAVHNGNFEDGIASWRILGRQDPPIELETKEFHIEDETRNELFVSRQAREGNVNILNLRPIKIEQGETYRVEVSARGEGRFRIGLTENDPGFVRTRYSPYFELGEQVETYVFEYTPSPDCVEIRPVINLPPAGEDMPLTTIRVRKYFFPIDKNLFDEATSWPGE